MANPESVSEHQVFSFQNMLYLAFPPLVNMIEQPTGNLEGHHVHRIIRFFFFKLAGRGEGGLDGFF